MKATSLYKIHLTTLKEPSETFEFKLDKAFFEQYSDDSIENVACVADVHCEKTDRMLICNFAIRGTLMLLCDRSLKPFEHKVDVKSTIYFKFGEEYEEQAEDLIVIPADTVEIDLSQPIFDILYLSIPSRRLHPDHRDELSEKSYFFTTEKQEATTSKAENSDNVDPRWEALQKLKKQ